MERGQRIAFVVVLIAALCGVGAWWAYSRSDTSTRGSLIQNPFRSEDDTESNEVGAVSIIASELEVPWDMAFLPDGSILVTERPGRVRLISPDGKLTGTPVATIENVRHIGEGGLLGIALHPDFASNNYVYLYYTYDGTEGDGDTDGSMLNRVVRMTYEEQELHGEDIIIDAIPGAPNHNGGQVAFGPAGYLYITTGDAQNPSRAQDTNSLAGKILRTTDDGEPAPGNPFNNRTYSYGHRNPQGLAWDADGHLWSTEHGRSGALSGLDEVNRIERGGNYGWPIIQGDESRDGMIGPYIHSGATTTWAPAGAAIIDSTLYFAGLRGRELYSVDINADSPKAHHALDESFGRLRAVVAGPDGALYVSTSNRDGRGVPTHEDDRILRIVK